MSNRDVLNSPRLFKFKKERRKKIFKRTIHALAIFLCIFLTLSFLSGWDKINIKTIEISGNKTVDAEKIRAIAKETIAGKYFLWFFSRSNFLIFPERNIREKILSEHKRIKDVSFKTKSFPVLEIILTERSFAYAWCGNSPDDFRGECYFMDEEGYVFDQAPYFSGNVYFKFFGKIGADERNPLGAYFFKEDFKKLVDFKKDLEQAGIEPKMMYLDENRNGNVHIGSAEPKNSPKIIFKTNEDLKKTMENLLFVLSGDPLQTEFKKGFPTLLYIDLRFGNKVYYKFR